MILDHVCIAVRSVDDAAEKLNELIGYERKTVPVTNSRHRVNVLFTGKAGSLDIKLIEPSDDESPLWEFLKKGEGLHHLCFRVEDVRDACREFVKKRVKILARPAPGEAFCNHDIAFCYLGLGLNAELVDTDERVWAEESLP